MGSLSINLNERYSLELLGSKSESGEMRDSNEVFYKFSARITKFKASFFLLQQRLS